MKWRSLEESTPGLDARTLGEIFAERKQMIANYVPASTQSVHEQAIAELKARQVASNIPAVGRKAPPFELEDHHGKMVSSRELAASGRLIVCFIRGRWCPFCVGQMEALNRIWPEIEKAGSRLVAISPQTVKQSFFMHDQHRLRFPLLSDRGNQVARQFGLTYRVPPAQEAVYRRAFVNLPFLNGEDSWELPIPATFILDGDGTILYSSANEDYMERPEPAALVKFLQGVR
jgi:peroxiredoxin